MTAKNKVRMTAEEYIALNAKKCQEEAEKILANVTCELDAFFAVLERGDTWKYENVKNFSTYNCYSREVYELVVQELATYGFHAELTEHKTDDYGDVRIQYGFRVYNPESKAPIG